MTLTFLEIAFLPFLLAVPCAFALCVVFIYHCLAPCTASLSPWWFVLAVFPCWPTQCPLLLRMLRVAVLCLAVPHRWSAAWAHGTPLVQVAGGGPPSAGV